MYTAEKLGKSSLDSQMSSLKATLTTNPQSLSPQLRFSASVSAVVGAILGIMISLIVNSTLIEISVSPFFSLYFGILFLSVGGIILWRIHAVTQFQPLTTDELQRKKQLTSFGSLIILSGLLCFILERHWFVGLPYLLKVPLYAILGIAVSFALTFALVDVLNYLGGFLQISYARPLVESPNQVFLVLSVSLAMGAFFGLIFGLMDVEDAPAYTIQLALMKEENYCYPIGALLGGLAGFGNEIIRAKGEEYSALANTDFDDDI